MDVTIEEKSIAENLTVVEVSGRLNGASAPEFKNRIKAILASGRTQLIIDMNAVSFIDSSGLSVLIAGLKYAREVGGFLRLARLQDQALKVFKLMLLDRVFNIYPSVEEAQKNQ